MRARDHLYGHQRLLPQAHEDPVGTRLVRVSWASSQMVGVVHYGVAKGQWVALLVEVPQVFKHMVHGPRCLGAAVLRRHDRPGQLVSVAAALSTQVAPQRRLALDRRGSGRCLSLQGR